MEMFRQLPWERYHCVTPGASTRDSSVQRFKAPDIPKIWLLLTRNQRAVGRSCFPRARIIDPGIAADYGSRPMRAPDFGIIGKFVM